MKVKLWFVACLISAVVLGAGGTADPEAEVAPIPVVDLATAGPGPSPTLGPVLKAAHHAGASPNRLPGPVQSPSLNPSPNPSLSLAPGVPLHDQTKGPNQDLDHQADPSLQRLMELRLNREI